MTNLTTTKFEASLTSARSTCLSLERQAGNMSLWESCPCDGRYLSPSDEAEVRKQHTEDMQHWVEGVRVEYSSLYAFVQREEGRTRPRGLTHPSEIYFRWVR
jgi:hypothetical protein